MKPSEHKTVQSRILKYSQAIGWTYVSRTEAEQRRGFEPNDATSEERVNRASLYFFDLLYNKVREFNPEYSYAPGILLSRLLYSRADIHGNQEMFNNLRNIGKFFYAKEKRELDLILIDYENPDRNVYEVTGSTQTVPLSGTSSCAS